MVAHPVAVGELAHEVPDWLERRAVRSRARAAGATRRRRAGRRRT